MLFNLTLKRLQTNHYTIAFLGAFTLFINRSIAVCWASARLCCRRFKQARTRGNELPILTSTRVEFTPHLLVQNAYIENRVLLFNRLYDLVEATEDQWNKLGYPFNSNIERWLKPPLFDVAQRRSRKPQLTIRVAEDNVSRFYLR
ncbi:hypothetical protein OH492_13560 [Vibrio chagasii]|nr:hypothetical protein [Vibrio chagasii]